MLYLQELYVDLPFEGVGEVVVERVGKHAVDQLLDQLQKAVLLDL